MFHLVKSEKIHAMDGLEKKRTRKGSTSTITLATRNVGKSIKFRNNTPRNNTGPR